MSHDLPERSGERRDDFTERRPRSSSGDGRRARDEEAAMRSRYAKEKEDANRHSIGNVRSEVLMVRQELRADIEKVSDASRARDKELHQKFDTRNEKFDDRLDRHKDELTTVRTELATLNRLMEKQAQAEWDEAPFYARPSYIKAMGLAVAAIIAAVLTSLGLVFGWGGAPPIPPTEDGMHHEAPADPGPEDG